MRDRKLSLSIRPGYSFCGWESTCCDQIVVGLVSIGDGEIC